MLEQRVQPIVLIGEQAIARPALPADEAVDQLPLAAASAVAIFALVIIPFPLVARTAMAAW